MSYLNQLETDQRNVASAQSLYRDLLLKKINNVVEKYEGLSGWDAHLHQLKSDYGQLCSGTKLHVSQSKNPLLLECMEKVCLDSKNTPMNRNSFVLLSAYRTHFYSFIFAE